MSATRKQFPAIRIACTARLLLVLPLTLPAVVQAQFTFVTNNGTITIKEYTGSGGAVTIPSTINGLPVTSIGKDAFERNGSSVTSVTIPNSVTSIGNYAFEGCSSLTRVTIPDSITSIGLSVFFNCSSLTSVTIPNSITTIESIAFENCTSLTEVYFQGNAPSLGSSVFDNDNNATVYYLPGATGWGQTFGGRPTALWKPKVLTSDGSFGVRTNQFGFNINWASGQFVVVDACTNPASPIWSPLKTNTLTSDTFYFSDPEWTNYPARFYRLRSP